MIGSDIPAPDIENPAVASPFDDNDSVRRAGETESARYLVDEVFRFGFPGMVRDDDCHTKVGGEFTQSDERVIVGFVGGL